MKLDLKPVSENHRAFPECTSEMQLSIVKLSPYQYQQYRTGPEDSAHHNKSGFCAYRQIRTGVNRRARRKERKYKKKDYSHALQALDFGAFFLFATSFVFVY